VSALSPVVAQLLHDVDRLPGRSPALLRLAELADDPESSPAALVDVCAADPAFTGRLLRLANSAHYGQRGEVTTLAAAVRLVGRTTLRTTALAMALGLGGEHGGLPEGFAARAALLAAAAQQVAPEVGAAAGDALCAGLLADLGQALLFRAAPAAYGALLLDTPAKELCEAERAWCGTDHADLGAQVLRASGVPELLCAAIAAHHEPVPDAGPLGVALRAAVLVVTDDDEALSGLGVLTADRLTATDVPRLVLSATASAAALASALG
jgi:HD-like signal output (HDOD) protein